MKEARKEGRKEHFPLLKVRKGRSKDKRDRKGKERKGRKEKGRKKSK